MVFVKLYPKFIVATVQLNLNITDACGYMHVRTHFTRVKVYNVECIFFVAYRFVMHTRVIKQSWHTICTHLFSLLRTYYLCIYQDRVHVNETHKMCGENTHAHANQNA